LPGSRITVVTQYYWPDEVGIAPYSTRLAEHLVEMGEIGRASCRERV